MNSKNGRTFWDFIHENKSIRNTLIAIVILIIVAVVFFLFKGYSISTSGITPPNGMPRSNDVTDTTIYKRDSTFRNIDFKLSPVENYDLKMNNISTLIWVSIFLICLSILISVLLFAISNSRTKKGNYVGEASKKVEVFEYIYGQYNKYVIYDRDKSHELLTEVQSLVKYTIENGLYIDKDLTILINDFTDYFKEVIVDYRKKNFSTEQEFQKRFKRLFK